jgi:hypothetical protein
MKSRRIIENITTPGILLVVFIGLFVAQSRARPCPPAPHAMTDTTTGAVPYYLIKDVHGKTINVAAQKGKVLFLNFWALSLLPFYLLTAANVKPMC